MASEMTVTENTTSSSEMWYEQPPVWALDSCQYEIKLDIRTELLALEKAAENRKQESASVSSREFEREPRAELIPRLSTGDGEDEEEEEEMGLARVMRTKSAVVCILVKEGAALAALCGLEKQMGADPEKEAQLAVDDYQRRDVALAVCFGQMLAFLPFHSICASRTAVTLPRTVVSSLPCAPPLFLTCDYDPTPKPEETYSEYGTTGSVVTSDDEWSTTDEDEQDEDGEDGEEVGGKRVTSGEIKTAGNTRNNHTEEPSPALGVVDDAEQPQPASLYKTKLFEIYPTTLAMFSVAASAGVLPPRFAGELENAGPWAKGEKIISWAIACGATANISLLHDVARRQVSKRQFFTQGDVKQEALECVNNYVAGAIIADNVQSIDLLLRFPPLPWAEAIATYFHLTQFNRGSHDDRPPVDWRNVEPIFRIYYHFFDYCPTRNDDVMWDIEFSQFLRHTLKKRLEKKRKKDRKNEAEVLGLRDFKAEQGEDIDEDVKVAEEERKIDEQEEEELKALPVIPQDNFSAVHARLVSYIVFEKQHNHYPRLNLPRSKNPKRSGAGSHSSSDNDDNEEDTATDDEDASEGPHVQKHHLLPEFISAGHMKFPTAQTASFIAMLAERLNRGTFYPLLVPDHTHHVTTGHQASSSEVGAKKMFSRLDLNKFVLDLTPNDANAWLNLLFTQKPHEVVELELPPVSSSSCSASGNASKIRQTFTKLEAALRYVEIELSEADKNKTFDESGCWNVMALTIDQIGAKEATIRGTSYTAQEMGRKTLAISLAKKRDFGTTSCEWDTCGMVLRPPPPATRISSSSAAERDNGADRAVASDSFFVYGAPGGDDNRARLAGSSDDNDDEEENEEAESDDDKEQQHEKKSKKKKTGKLFSNIECVTVALGIDNKRQVMWAHVGFLLFRNERATTGSSANNHQQAAAGGKSGRSMETTTTVTIPWSIAVAVEVAVLKALAAVGKKLSDVRVFLPKAETNADWLVGGGGPYRPTGPCESVLRLTELEIYLVALSLGERSLLTDLATDDPPEIIERVIQVLTPARISERGRRTVESILDFELLWKS